MKVEQTDRDAAEPWCDTCGAAVHEILCPTCAKWWDDNLAAKAERTKITAWLRSLDRESGDINRFLPTTLANWIDERMHEL